MESMGNSFFGEHISLYGSDAVRRRWLILVKFGIWRLPGSVVVIVTGYGLDGPGIESRWARVFPHLSRPALGPTQPPVQWVPGLSPVVKSGRGVTQTSHPLLVLWSRQSRAIPLLSLWAVRPVQSLSACTFMYLFIYLFTVVGACRFCTFIVNVLWTAVVQWLRCCATNWLVAGAIPAGVTGIINWHKILPIVLWSSGRPIL